MRYQGSENLRVLCSSVLLAAGHTYAEIHPKATPTRLPDLVRKHARQAVNRLPFLCRNLRWVDLMLGRNLLRRLVCAQRLKRNHGLKLIRKTASRRHFCILSSMLDTS
jgi:hypothetical protein